MYIAPGEEAVVTPDRPRPSSARSAGPAPATRVAPVRPSTPATAGTAASRRPAGDGHNGEGNPDEDSSLHP